MTFSTAPPPEALQNQASSFRIGFITPPFKDNKIPVTDHLHAHAFVGSPDLVGWWRGVAYSPIAWYAIDDLIAEIRCAFWRSQATRSDDLFLSLRETVSNNRVKSGYENRAGAPIDMVPAAGARSGRADGTETTEEGISNPHSRLEDGESISRSGGLTNS